MRFVKLVVRRLSCLCRIGDHINENIQQSNSLAEFWDLNLLRKTGMFECLNVSYRKHDLKDVD